MHIIPIKDKNIQEVKNERKKPEEYKKPLAS